MIIDKKNSYQKSKKKYTNYKLFVKSVFKNITDEQIKKIKFTKESLYSISKIIGASFLYKVIKLFFKNTNQLKLIDGTANIGSDSIFLADHFKEIHAIEFNRENYDALVNNIKVMRKTNIKSYYNDTNEITPTLKKDIIYIDAPWGGPDYYKENKIYLYLGDIEIIDFYLKNKNQAKLFIFKVPFNYNFQRIDQLKIKYKIYHFKVKDIIKYILIVI